MPYVLPTFNLQCNIWHNPSVLTLYAAPDLTVGCNLALGRRSYPVGGLTTTGLRVPLLLPALTDVRAYWNAVTGDLLEVPAGSFRFYSVLEVEDVGKGFANEHRMALIGYDAGGFTFSTGLIPAPVPFP